MNKIDKFFGNDFAYVTGNDIVKDVLRISFRVLGVNAVNIRNTFIAARRRIDIVFVFLR